MKQQFVYIALLLITMLFVSCSKENVPNNEDEGGNYMKLSTRSDEDINSAEACFIFWKHTDFDSFGFDDNPATPYVYSLPTGMIDDYNATLSKPKYNTGEIYPPYSEPVYAVGVSPAVILGENPLSWKTFAVPDTMTGIVDIQCAPVIVGTEQSPFSEPLKFAHQLAKLEFKGFCGSSMREGNDKYIDIDSIKISISSDVSNQWQWFPKELTWTHGGVGVGQYTVNAYESQPTKIVAQVLSSNPILGKKDTVEAKAKPIGNFYLVPGFDKITVKVEAIYVDSTTDGDSPAPENGQENKRVWEEMTIEKIHSLTDEPTEIGHSYTIYLGFERSKIVLGVTLKDWGNDIEN